VAHQLSAEELTKAARNIAKIERYFGARLGWTIEDECREAFESLRATADRIAFTVGQKALSSGVEARLGGEREIEQTPPEPFEREHLLKVASFFGRLDRWFVDHAAGGLEKGGRRRLAAIQESLESTRLSLAEIDLNHKPSEFRKEDGEQPDDGAPSGPHAAVRQPSERSGSQPAIAQRAASDSAPADDVYAGARAQAEYVAAKRPEQFAFSLEGAEPMYRWVGSNSVDLTEAGRQRLEGLFEEQGISYFRYQLEKFVDEIKMRIENAPNGHVLVVKVRTIGDEKKPFLSYIPEQQAHEK
jgi:hypothetical protein